MKRANRCDKWGERNFGRTDISPAFLKANIATVEVAVVENKNDNVCRKKGFARSLTCMIFTNTFFNAIAQALLLLLNYMRDYVSQTFRFNRSTEQEKVMKEYLFANLFEDVIEEERKLDKHDQFIELTHQLKMSRKWVLRIILSCQSLHWTNW